MRARSTSASFSFLLVLPAIFWAGVSFRQKKQREGASCGCCADDSELSPSGSTCDFVISFCAIVPLASLLGDATEQCSLKLGGSVGGLLNATFGNAVEAIVGIIALMKGELRIVQTSMLGSILSNVLLVLGCSFLAAGWKVSPLLSQAQV